MTRKSCCLSYPPPLPQTHAPGAVFYSSFSLTRGFPASSTPASAAICNKVVVGSSKQHNKQVPVLLSLRHLSVKKSNNPLLCSLSLSCPLWTCCCDAAQGGSGHSLSTGGVWGQHRGHSPCIWTMLNYPQRCAWAPKHHGSHPELGQVQPQAHRM